MMRRRHKKSRRGCHECKRRHIKCDETRPRCINCATVERECSYPSGEGLDSESGVSSTRTSPAGSTSASAHTPAPDAVFQSEIPGFSPLGELHPPRVDMVHMELFHHYITNFPALYPPLVGMPLAITMRHALREPYLMHQVLALSAQHLSVLRPHQEGFYRNIAIQLQTQALALFNSLDLGYFDMALDHRVAAFVFSSVLGFHSLCDALSYRDSYFPTSLDRFLRYLHLHRGVHNSSEGRWLEIRESELRTTIEQSMAWYNVNGQGRECDDIRQRAQASANLSMEELEATMKAIDLLQTVFDGRPTPQSRIHILFNWTMMLPTEFVGMMDAGRPEALAVLAYYFLALHHCHNEWMVGDSCHFLLQSVANYLHPDWASWVERPCQMLEEMLNDEGSISPAMLSIPPQ
ncbi:hypothetical protein B0H63DRAFT_207634 [Podospora didyma]|uniref:Zn(2)-C6 fungal-type domain-containing protein n=1 Tax=Podospora didyma TaxID=330526 RepID=A0AAE0NHB9_9PEZI|nr:hypothetical protein B0H63DRAFT_207634 [Podospora didyma]